MHRIATLGVLAVVATTACAEYELDRGVDADTGYPGDYQDTDNAGPEDPDNDDWEPPPEQEDDFLALRPAETDVYVFVANPGRGTVTRVNVYTQEVRTTPVGVDPTVVLTTPDYATAVVFNRGDDTVSIVDADTLDTVTVDVRDNFNNMVMSPDGTWVALWHDLARVRPDDPPAQGLQSFNEVSFVHLPTGEHHAMAVGFNPRSVEWTPDGLLAAVVSDEYLAMVDVTDVPLVPNLIQVAEDLLDAPRAEEVLLSPNGDWAFVRQFGGTDLVVVDLLTEDVARIPVGGNPTDLDFTPDGNEAVVVARDAGELWVFDTAAPIDIPPRVLDLALPEDVRLGSVLFAPSGDRAVIYTTASPVDRFATWDLDTDEVTLRPLVKPVRSVAVTPTGASLLVFHDEEDAPGADPSSPFHGEWALTMIDLDDYRTNPLKLPAEPIGYANSTDGRHGYFIMEDQPYLEILDYQTLLYDQLTLRSDPVYVGVLPDLDPTDDVEPPAWVSQEHDLGRISFFDPASQVLETITGFELNSRIEE